MENRNSIKEKKIFKVISCSKCGQYFYLKCDQYKKKCLRCGKINLISEDIGIHVQGMTAALNKVRELQYNYALNDRENSSELRASNDFILHIKGEITSQKPNFVKQNKPAKKNYLSDLKKILIEIYKEFGDFPKNIVELKARNIPKKELNQLLKKLIFEEFLLERPNDYLKVNI